MCGIFGIVTATEQALGPILIEAARRLTYRGYDSVGAATISGAKVNSQPHLDSDGDMVGAHNGNVVNNVELRQMFMDEGLVVRSQNDGESCVHAVERYVDRGLDFIEAILNVTPHLLFIQTKIDILRRDAYFDDEGVGVRHDQHDRLALVDNPADRIDGTHPPRRQ